MRTALLALLLPLVSCATGTLWDRSMTPTVTEVTIVESCELRANGLRVPENPEVEPLLLEIELPESVPPLLSTRVLGPRGWLSLTVAEGETPRATALSAVATGLFGLELDSVSLRVESRRDQVRTAELELAGPMFPQTLARRVAAPSAGATVVPDAGLELALQRVLDPRGAWAPILFELSSWGRGPIDVRVVRLGPANASFREVAAVGSDVERAEWERLWGRTLIVVAERDGVQRTFELRAEFLWLTQFLEPEVEGLRFRMRSRWNAAVLPIAAGQRVVRARFRLEGPRSVAYTEERVEQQPESIADDVVLAFLATPVTAAFDLVTFSWLWGSPDRDTTSATK